MSKYFKEKNIGLIMTVMALGSISFMLFEPLKDYLSNLDDYWFSFWDYISLILASTAALWIVGVVFFVIIGFINTKAANYVTVVGFFLIIGLYVQGNFIPNTTGALDGSAIDWTKVNIGMILSDILWIALIVVCVFVLRKV